MTHQNTLLTQTKMCPKGFDDEHYQDPTFAIATDFLYDLILLNRL